MQKIYILLLFLYSLFSLGIYATVTAISIVIAKDLVDNPYYGSLLVVRVLWLLFAPIAILVGFVILYNWVKH